MTDFSPEKNFPLAISKTQRKSPVKNDSPRKESKSPRREKTNGGSRTRSLLRNTDDATLKPHGKVMTRRNQASTSLTARQAHGGILLLGSSSARMASAESIDSVTKAKMANGPKFTKHSLPSMPAASKKSSQK